MDRTKLHSKMMNSQLTMTQEQLIEMAREFPDVSKTLYGSDDYSEQLYICIEEMAELTKELTKVLRGKTERIGCIEEMAHVQIILWNLCTVLGIPMEEVYHAAQITMEESMKTVIDKLARKQANIKAAIENGFHPISDKSACPGTGSQRFYSKNTGVSVTMDFINGCYRFRNIHTDMICNRQMPATGKKFPDMVNDFIRSCLDANDKYDNSIPYRVSDENLSMYLADYHYAFTATDNDQERALYTSLENDNVAVALNRKTGCYLFKDMDTGISSPMYNDIMDRIVFSNRREAFLKQLEEESKE